MYISKQTHTAPELVTVLQAKKQLKLDASDQTEDDLIEGYIAAAIVDAENYTNTSIFEANYLIEGEAFEQNLAIKLNPAQSVVISYLNAAGATVVLGAENYRLRNLDTYQKEIYYKAFSDLPAVKADTDNAVSILVTTGYTAATLPMAIYQAILLKVTNYYEQRNDGVEVLSKASENLLRNYRFYY